LSLTPIANPFPGRELVFDEESNTYRVRSTEPPTQRRPETGERLDGTRRQRGIFDCYFCGREAHTVAGGELPSCIRCLERYRRKD